LFSLLFSPPPDTDHLRHRFSAWVSVVDGHVAVLMEAAMEKQLAVESVEWLNGMTLDGEHALEETDLDLATYQWLAEPHLRYYEREQGHTSMDALDLRSNMLAQFQADAQRIVSSDLAVSETLAR
jgi:hypothetical protein